MSGHSKWSQIKHQKGKTDALRGQMFTKLANAITITVKESRGITDPQSNFKLRLAIEKARAFNMPKINIDRAIERGLGKGEGGGLEEVIYEGLGPGKVAILVQVATNNRQRTNAQLKNLFAESGGALLGPGSVSYLFKNCGEIKAKRNNLSEDECMEIALNVGSSDVEIIDEETVIFYTEPENLHKVKEELIKKGLEIIEVELSFKPVTTVRVEDKETAQKLLEFISKLENETEVQKVSANFD